MAITYGVSRDSILNSSKFFHVTEGLAPDIMHDVLEGCLQYEVKEILKYFIQDQKLFSLAELNRKITSFPYGYVDSANRPIPITNSSLTSSDHSLKQTGMLSSLHNWNKDRLFSYCIASQMWCLANDWKQHISE